MRNRLALLFILLAAACGDDGGNTKVDAGPPDTLDVDAQNDTPVTLTVKLNNAPLAGVRVHFQNPDSSLIASVDTDASGVASSPMPSGGFVTAIDPFAGALGVGGNHNLYSYSGVKPGDALELFDTSGGTSANDLTITAPIDTDAAVTQYMFVTECDSITQPSAGTVANTETTFTLFSQCSPTSDILIASLDANNEVVHWVYAANQTTSGATLDLSGLTLNTAPTSKTFTFNNIPVASEGVFFAQQLYAGSSEFIEFSGDGVGATVSQTLKVTPFTNALDLVFALTGGAESLNFMLDWNTTFQTSYTTDVGARLLSQVTSGASYDTTTRALTWGAGTGGVTPDFASSELDVTRGTGTLTYIRWRIIAPYDGGELQYPTLPVEGTDFNPMATDTIELQSTTLGKTPLGYDGIRPKFYGLSGPDQLTTFAAAGSVDFQNVFAAGGLFAPLKHTLDVGSGRKRVPFYLRADRRQP